MKTFLALLFVPSLLFAAVDVVVTDALQVTIGGLNAGRIEHVIKNFVSIKDDIEVKVDDKIALLCDTDPHAAASMLADVKRRGIYTRPALDTIVSDAVAAWDAAHPAQPVSPENP